MTANATLDSLSRTTLNQAVNDAWSQGLPEAMRTDWTYLDTMPGERGVDRGRARLIVQRKRDYAVYAIPFFESVGEMDMYQDRFRGEDIEFVPVIPYRRVVEYTDYKPVAEDRYPLTSPISIHVSPHLD